MRKIALLAMLAIVMAMVPATTAGSQVDAQGPVGEVHMINGTEDDYDLWIEVDDGDFKKFELDDGTSADYKFPAGNKDWVVCENDSTTPSCDTGGPYGSGVFPLSNGQNVTAVIYQPFFNPSQVDLYTHANDKEATKVDEARFTLHNATPPPANQVFTICLNGEPVLQDVVALDTEDVDTEAGDPDTTLEVVPGGGSNCPGAEESEIPFAAGTNFILTITVNRDCASNCVQILLVGEDPTKSDQSAADFCTILPQIQGVSAILEGLFLGVDVGDPDTYPSEEDVQQAVEQISELLESGDEVVPADIADTWYEATDELRQLLTGLELVDFDVNDLPQDDLQSIVDGIEEPSGPTPEDEARQAELGAWFTANCTVETQEISFTG